MSTVLHQSQFISQIQIWIKLVKWRRLENNIDGMNLQQHAESPFFYIQLVEYIGQNYQDGKYTLFVSLFVSFHCDLESKLAIREPKKNHPIKKYTKRSDDIALFSLQVWSI